MSKINQVACQELFANTGFSDCTFVPREIFGMLLVSGDFVIKNTDMANLQSFLRTASLNPIKGKRLRPVMGFVGATDNSEDRVTFTTGYGTTRTLRDGAYSWTFQFINGGMCLLNKLRALNGQLPNVIFVDKAYNLIGTNRDGGLAGVPLADFWADKWSLNDGAGNPTNLGVAVSIDPTYLNERLAFIQTATIPNFDISVIRGVQDILIEEVSSSASSIVVKLTDSCSGSNDFSDTYGEDLEVPALWEATTPAGVVQTIDTVTYSDTAKTYTIAFNPNRAAATLLKLAPIDDLAAAGIAGYESNTIDVVAP